MLIRLRDRSGSSRGKNVLHACQLPGALVSSCSEERPAHRDGGCHRHLSSRGFPSGCAHIGGLNMPRTEVLSGTLRFVVTPGGSHAPYRCASWCSFEERRRAPSCTCRGTVDHTCTRKRHVACVSTQALKQRTAAPRSPPQCTANPPLKRCAAAWSRVYITTMGAVQRRRTSGGRRGGQKRSLALESEVFSLLS